MEHHLPHRLSRRQLLIGGAGAVLLAACGDDNGATPSQSTTSTSAGAAAFTLVQFFGEDVLRPGLPQRAPFGLGDRDGVVTSGGPDALVFDVLFKGAVVGDPVTAERHDEQLPRPYYPLVFTPEQAGTYEVATEIDGSRLTAAITVAPADQVTVPQVGDQMIAVDTPTAANPAGVDPICTREPACPLHDVTLTAALAENRPLAFLIATPKFCQTAICGPVLDVLVAQQADFPDVRMVHAEVYTDEGTQTTTAAVDQYGLTFEPCLFLAAPGAAITHRIDTIFDAVELHTALTDLVAHD